MSTKSFFRSTLIAVSALVVGMVLASRLGLSPASFAGNLTVPATNSAPLTGPIDASTFRTVAQTASPSVVSIRTTATRQGIGLDDLFGLDPRLQGNGRRQAPSQIVQGAGSGFIIDKNGYILTNNHVVEDATRVEVYLAGMNMNANDRGLPAKVVGKDLLTDAALIQLTDLPDQPLTVAKFGDSSQLAQGDWVMAIGNPFGLSNTVTVGVVSAVGRQQQTAVNQRYEEMIQTDAAINRGNSGGPLLNIRGEVVGINTQIVSDQSGGNLGIGFAVPINTVRDILPSLEKGKVVRGRIGVQVSMTALTKEDAEDRGLPAVGGAVIMSVGDGPAKAAGMRPDDVVIEFNGKPVKNSSELVSMVTSTTPGTTVPVKVVRARKTLTLNVKVEELDIESEQAPVQLSDNRRSPQAEEPKDTGFGMSVEGVTASMARRLNAPSGAGVIVSEVEQGGPAARNGIRAGDIIVRINDVPVTSVDQVTKALDAIPANRTARVVVFRDGAENLVLMRK
ncbi:MAG TPA: trypsin-like peptidase domain-containing protein [Vicinamibacterales bacterium]|nr:trypsin-like peptidase domain-containing protein [Vicinamibacterales bacterium]